jgi:hypothetical protein
MFRMRSIVTPTGAAQAFVSRALLAAAALASVPSPGQAAEAGCRLSRSDCAILYHAMTEEAYAAAEDERRFRPNGLSRDERSAALVRRHLDRIDERSVLLPDRIADEWMRIEACGGTACR